MPQSHIEKQLEFLNTIERLKTIKRRNIVSDKSRPENPAEHSWQLALMVMVLHEYAAQRIDIFYAVKLALIHDLVETFAGDTYCYDIHNNRIAQNKLKREQQAAKELFALLPPEQQAEFERYWYAFESMQCPEAQFVQSLDRLQPVLLHLLTHGVIWQQNKITLKQLKERTRIVHEYLPKLSPTLKRMIQTAKDKGYLEIIE